MNELQLNSFKEDPSLPPTRSEPLKTSTHGRSKNLKKTMQKRRAKMEARSRKSRGLKLTLFAPAKSKRTFAFSGKTWNSIENRGGPKARAGHQPLINRLLRLINRWMTLINRIMLWMSLLRPLINKKMLLINGTMALQRRLFVLPSQDAASHGPPEMMSLLITSHRPLHFFLISYRKSRKNL